MGTDDRDVDAMIATVRAAAAEAGSHVVGVLLSIEYAAMPAAGMNVDRLAALIRAVRPRVVYCLGIAFDAGEQVLSDLSDDDADESLLEQPRVRKLVSKWRSRDGQTAQVVATVVVDGVIHGLLVQPAWYDEYEADIEAHGEEAERLQDERDRRAEADAKARLGPLVRKLMADPRFSSGKVGRAKRLTLAEALFPDEDRAVLGEVVDLAESQHWLATGR